MPRTGSQGSYVRFPAHHGLEIQASHTLKSQLVKSSMGERFHIISRRLFSNQELGLVWSGISQQYMESSILSDIGQFQILPRNV